MNQEEQSIVIKFCWNQECGAERIQQEFMTPTGGLSSSSAAMTFRNCTTLPANFSKDQSGYCEFCSRGRHVIAMALQRGRVSVLITLSLLENGPQFADAIPMVQPSLGPKKGRLCCSSQQKTNHRRYWVDLYLERHREIREASCFQNAARTLFTRYKRL
jgi:hypothetical protein